MSDDKPGGETGKTSSGASDSETSENGRRRARVIDGTAEDVTGRESEKTDANTSQEMLARAMPVALPVIAFFAGAAILAAVLWQAGLLANEPVSGDVLSQLDAANDRIAALSRDIDRQGTELRQAQQAREQLADQLNAAGEGNTVLPEDVASTSDLNAALRLVAEMEGRLTDVETAVKNATTAVQQDEFAALSEEMAALGARVSANEETAAQMGDVDRRIAAIETGIAAVGGRQENLDGAQAGLQEKVGALTARMEAASQQLAAQAERLDNFSARADKFDERIAANEARVDRPEAARRAALGIALASLAGAAAETGPFEEELETVAAYVPGNETVAALEEAAETGVPDAGLLLRRFKPLALEALKADAAGAATGIWDTLVGNARSLVTVRRTGQLEGDSAEARLARAEQALNAGRVGEAVDEVAALEGPAAETMANWLEDARTRAKVNELVAELRRTLVADLAVAHAAPEPAPAEESEAQ